MSKVTIDSSIMYVGYQRYKDLPDVVDMAVCKIYFIFLKNEIIRLRSMISFFEITCKQSSAVMTIRGDLLWHASSKVWKYCSAMIVVELSFGKGSADDEESSVCPTRLISF